MREHGVQVDDLGNSSAPGSHQLDGVALEQLHAPGDFRHLATGLPGPLQTVGQQRGDHRLALDQGHLAAQGSQHEGVPPQPGRGIQHPRAYRPADTHRPCHHLPRPAAVLAAMGQGAFDKIDPHCTRGVLGGGQQAEAIVAQLQQQIGGVALCVGGQIQAGGQ